MRASTHFGHCQLCGNLQKLPAGALSLHGYNVAHGFFSGTCAGARALPFERSCDLVAASVASAERQLAVVEAHQQQLRASTTAEAWMRVHYSRTAFGDKPRTAWEQVTLRGTWVPYADGDGGSMQYQFTDATGRVHGADLGDRLHGLQRWALPDASDEQLLALTARKHNAQYADWLEHEADSLRRYIKWQQARVIAWAPAELLVVKVRDKAGFVPTEARY